VSDLMGNSIPINAKVVINMRLDDRKHKGRITINNDNIIAIDQPKKLGGTYFNKEFIESIVIIDRFKLIKKLFKKHIN
jgi:hypothetical protein